MLKTRLKIQYHDVVRWFLLVFLFFGGSPAFGDDFGQAALHYQSGEFLQAAKLYEQGLNEEHQNSSLLFNIGNSYYKGGRLGDAMAAYLAASSLAPRDPDIRANLSFVQGKLKNKFLMEAHPLDRWLGLSEFLSKKELFFLAVTFAILGSILLSSSIIWNRSYMLSGLLGFFLALVFTISFIYRQAFERQWGAIRKAEVSVFTGPSDKNSVVVFKLFEGMPVMLKEKQGDWTAIELADQKRGWVKSQQVRFF